MDLRTDRLGLLADQFASSAEISLARLAGLTDAEFFWEPVTPMYSLRRRGSVPDDDAYGPGEWRLDFRIPEPEPVPPGTIAWRLGHVLSMLAGRWEWTFGTRSIAPQDCVDFAGDAAGAMAQLDAQVTRWQSSIETLTDEQLDTVGFGQYPWGLDPDLPFAGIVWWINREFIHHTAEIALLRDLYAGRETLRGQR